MLDNKTILITGGTGSWANELVRQLLEKYNPKEIRIYSRGEQKQVEMKLKFNSPKLKFFIGDVRNKDRLRLACENVDYIFHLAALKHVPVCEENPWEAVLTNIYGAQNIIDVAIECEVKKVIDVSTDKAVDPLNLYGITKACGEKLMIAANNLTEKTFFVAIRGGNVIGTSGSVVPLFKRQILENNQITLTNENMTRFFLNLSDAINLIFKALIDSVGGEIFVMKMPAAKIIDLADVMINSLGNDNTSVKVIGIRPGEKIHEVLVSRYEASKTIDIGDYFIILPHIEISKMKERYKDIKFTNIAEFNSQNTKRLNKEEIKNMLEKENWLDKNIKVPDHFLEKLPKEMLSELFRKQGWLN